MEKMTEKGRRAKGERRKAKMEIVCDGKTTREINLELKRLVAEGEDDILLKSPMARHNLSVAILQPVKITIDGSVGYYCAGMIDRPTIEIRGSAGWGLAESMLSGTVVVHGGAGNGAAASIRGGSVIIRGDAAARVGVSMKGGTVIVAGNCGYMAGFMSQKGTLIVCGNTGEAFADSMYETVCFVGGDIDNLGNDAVVSEITDGDLQFLKTSLGKYGIDDRRDWKKVLSGRKMWNFDKNEAIWQEAF